jgi:hypothetical protein
VIITNLPLDTVTQSSFADPCHPLAGGFFSGFVPTTPQTLGATFTITVKDTKPIWFYCSQTGAGGHCQKGMVGSVNAPKTGNTLDAFKKLAGNATTSTFPGGAFSPVGGTFVPAKNSNSTSTNGTSTSSGSGSGSGATSSFTSVYSTTYATSATIVTSVASTYTSGGQVYTTSVASTYTTAYTTAAAATSTGVSTGSGSTQVSAGAAAGLSANIVGMGAVVLGALAMV